MNFSDRQSELDAFKKLNLSVIASHYGYRIIKAKSTRHSILMKSGNSKIIVSKNGKHYVYCSVTNDNSNGTVIDFVQQEVETGASLGRIRQLLRPFLNGTHFSAIEKKNAGNYAASIRTSSTDFTGVAARYSQFEPASIGHRYLCEERGIPFELLLSDRIEGRIKHCPRTGAAIFPHWGPSNAKTGNDRILTGYEIKGASSNMFSRGGRKGLWSTVGFAQDQSLVFCESGLDALSYLAIHNPAQTRVFSISGQLSPAQIPLIQSAADRLTGKVEVIAAFDNDDAGDKLTSHLANLFGQHVAFRCVRPPLRGQDWNDALRLKTPC